MCRHRGHCRVVAWQQVGIDSIGYPILPHASDPPNLVYRVLDFVCETKIDFDQAMIAGTHREMTETLMRDTYDYHNGVAAVAQKTEAAVHSVHFHSHNCLTITGDYYPIK